ncbi:hypothetical protein ACA910_015247 [Epithemia clementina (nom. ined.)]
MKTIDHRESSASLTSLVSAHGGKESDRTVASTQYSDDISSDSGSVEGRGYHEAGVKSQYDTQEKLAFYNEVMGDGTGNIHFGKWDGVDMDEPGAYGKASELMTDHMFEVAMGLLKRPASATSRSPTASPKTISLIDLGAGTGGAARRLASLHPNLECTCLNLCERQNAISLEQNEEMGLGDRIQVHTGTYEHAPFENSKFDILFSQDALIHSFNKKQAYLEAKRIARPGAVFIFSDLMAGEEASPEELDSFASTNMVKDWMTPSQNIECLKEVGFRQVTFVDMTEDIKMSFVGMLKKVDELLTHAHDGLDQALLETYHKNLTKRISQCDRKIFSWGIIHSRKPIRVAIYPSLPVPFEPTVPELFDQFNGEADEETDVIVVDFTTRVKDEEVMALPKQVSLIVTLSSGKDHIACDTAASRGIRVASSDKTCITESVAEYGLCMIINGLRNIFGTIGVRFPGKDWTLSWNCQGLSMDQATIGIIGMGDIASLMVRKLRALSSSLRILYFEPEQFRKKDFEKEMNLEYCSSPLEVAKGGLDILMPLAPLVPATTNMINEEIFSVLPPTCGLINISRGLVVLQDALTKALKEERLKYAILDATTPEPLPDGHELLSMDNVHILPHYATNTLAVRQQLVGGIEGIAYDHYLP